MKHTPEQLKDILTTMGVTFSDCVNAFATPNDHPAIVKAREQWHQEGEIEIDEPTLISESDDDGEYVLAWVWVDLPKENG